MKNVAIAVMVKTPELSEVKTRLAAGIGRPASRQFFDLAQNALSQVLACAVVQCRQKNMALTAYWAVAEAEAVDHTRWNSFSRLHTGPGCLGQRMHHVYQQLRQQHDTVLLMGMDTPQISPKCLSQALQLASVNIRASATQHVLGPARDGGFYLFASGADWPQQPWLDVAYSQPDTLHQFKKSLGSAHFWLTWPALTDVDTQLNLQHIAQEFSAEPLPAQQKLINWLTHIDNPAS